MNTIPFIVFASLYPNLKERSVIIGLSSACFGTASIIGPLLGGWIVDTLTWHWIFYVNLPIALIAILIIGFLYREPRPQAAGKDVDFKGASLLVTGLVFCILLAIQMIGKWHYLSILLLLVLGVALLVCLFKVDQQAADPIVPSRLFTNHELLVDFILFIVIWGSFIAFVTYIPMWAQGILGLLALLGGITQIPGAVTNFIGSELVPMLQEKLNKYGLVAIGASTILIAFTGILWAGQAAPFWFLIFCKFRFKPMLN